MYPTISDVLANPVQEEQQPAVIPPLSLGLANLNLANNQSLLDTAAEYQRMKNAAEMEGLNNAISGLSGSISAQGGYNGVPTKTNNKHGLTPDFWNALSAANAAMKAAGLGTFTVTSGFRSDKQQAALYNKPHRAGYVAKPGSSKHRTGLAADLHLTTAQQNWLRKNGAKYGIYAPMWNPTGKNGVVERWHWQFKG